MTSGQETEREGSRIVPPETGHATIDAALAAIELDTDVNTHPAALAEALDVLAQALASSDDPSES